MKISTLLAQIGNRLDPNGAISFPIYNSATFRHPGLRESTGFDYSRTANPTRKVLEEAIANLEGGVKGYAFASGMAAITTILCLFAQGDHLIVTEDLYGGTYRLITKVFEQFGLSASYVDTSNINEIKNAIRPNTKAIFCETPTNPLMRIADIREISSFARKNGLLTIVDNTFLSPVLQRPLALGADIVIHSATKYLAGHNDLCAGLVAIKDEPLAERFGTLQNSLGAVLGPQDSWLLMRSLKTLALRVREQEKNAQQIAKWLTTHPLIDKVYYPGLETHPGYQTQHLQAAGFGAMLSFTVKDPALVPRLLSRIKIISFAESLGGVESLITYPLTQTHTDIPAETLTRLGINERLLRLSVGIEDVEDLIADLAQALKEE